LATFVFYPPASAQAAGTPSLPAPIAPRIVEHGGAAHVEAEPRQLDVCQLRLRHAGTRPVTATIRPGSASEVDWTWRVPAQARSATWDGAVRCWQELIGFGRGAPDLRQRFAVEVRGRRHGTLAIAAPGTMVTRLSDRSADTRASLEKWADWAQLVTAIAALVAIAFGLIPYLHARREAKRAESATIFDRLNSPEFVGRWSRILAFLRVADEAECVERIRRADAVPTGNHPLLPGRGGMESATLNDIVAAHNFFEETALRFNDGNLAQHLVSRGFAEIVNFACFNSWWWMHYTRRGHVAAQVPRRPREADELAEWEWMVRRMLRQSGTSRRDLAGAGPPVRAICLPLTEDDAEVGDWAACGRLSRAVGDVMRGAGEEKDEDGAKRLRTVLETMEPDLGTAALPDAPARKTILIPPLPGLVTKSPLPVRAARAVGARWDQRFSGSALGAPGAWLVRQDPWIRLCERHQDVAVLLEHRREQWGQDVDGLIDAIRARAAKLEADAAA
jgi:hypothetical protein